MTRALVVGYGNDLRRDDGAGRWVAGQIESRALPGVAVRSVSQLTPELALEVAGCEVVVFVDANVDVVELTVSRVDAELAAGSTMTHHGNPATLLGLVPAVGELPNESLVVSIPASDLDMGLEMTPTTRRAATEAVAVVLELLGVARSMDVTRPN